jgi:hypothetical protein
VAAAVLGLALAGCILLPLGSRDAVPTPRQRIVVAHDAGDFRVDPDGGLSVRETLDVEVVGTRERSLSLSIDRQDASDGRVRRDVTDLRVTRDGHAVTSFTRTTSAGRFTTVRIGTLASPRLSLGLHTYVVSYRMARVLEAGTAYPTGFDWAVVPATFGVPVEQADLTVHLPAPAAAATCTAQVPTGCALSGRHTRDLTAHVEGLPRLTAVRLDVGLSMAPPPGPARLPWSTHWAQVLGPSVRGVLVVVSLGLAAVLVGLFLARGAFEHRPRRREAPELPTEDLPRADVPPDGIGPPAAAYVAHERLDHKAFVATIFWAAQKGMVRIDRHGSRWQVTGTLSDEDPRARSDVGAALTAFLGDPRGTFAARRGDAASLPELEQRLSDMERATRDWCVSAGLVRRTGPGRGMSVVLIGVATFAAFFAALTQTGGRSLVGLVPAGFAAGALPLLGAGAATRRTRRGRDLAATLAGVRRTLTSPLAAGARTSSPEDLYLAFLPWAVMTGCLDPWTRRYRESTGIRPPSPDYLPRPVGATRAGAGPDDVGAVILDFGEAFEARRQREEPETT